MTPQLNPRPLHNLYQTISPATLLEHEHPLTAISQLERNHQTGQIECIVGVGAKGDVEDEWWATRLSPDGLEELTKQLKGTAIKKETMFERIREQWIEGRLDMKGYEGPQIVGVDHPSKNPRRSIQLVIYLVDLLPLSINLEPVDQCPLSLVSIMNHLIPPYLSSTSNRTLLTSLQPELTSTKSERDRLKHENQSLKNEVKELQLRLKEMSYSNSRGGGLKRGFEEGEEEAAHGSQSQRQSRGTNDREGDGGRGRGRTKSESVSPSKKIGVPGVDYKPVMKPGMKGYAGNAHRAGRIVEDEWEDPSDSE